MLATALACSLLAGAAAVPHTEQKYRRAAQAEELFACVNGQCVENPAGIPLALCQLACAPLPQNFTCASSGECVESDSGIPIADCERICLAPGPPPPAKDIVELALSVPDLSTLVTALKAADLVETLSGADSGPFTVFAPTNAAFAALPPEELRRLLLPANIAELQALLTFHVASGRVLSTDLSNGQNITTLEGGSVQITLRPGQVFVDRALVTAADNEASNGVVHIIDEVLVLPPVPPPPPPGPQNIVELAQSVPTLSTLVTAVVAANLQGTLAGPGPDGVGLTVFAPNNQAFSKLPAAELQRLLRPENIGELTAVLTLHVISGRIFKDEVRDGQKVTTLNGEELTFIKRNGVLFVFGGTTTASQVIAADNVATNGVVHIIDKVLLPSPANNNTASATALAAPELSKALVRTVAGQGATNQLFFYSLDGVGTRNPRCGQVDAAKYMPAAIFEPQHALALAAYVKATVELNTSVQFGKCESVGYQECTGGVQGISWLPGSLMGPVCKAKCDCSFRGGAPGLPGCKDQPDEPEKGRFCSLCGPTTACPGCSQDTVIITLCYKNETNNQ